MSDTILNEPFRERWRAPIFPAEMDVKKRSQPENLPKQRPIRRSYGFKIRIGRVGGV